MNNFWTLVKFEYKKTLFRKSSITLTILALCISIFCCFIMIIGSNTDSNYSRDDMTNYEAMLMDKGYEKEFSGRALDGDLILEASKAYQKVDSNAYTYINTEAYQKYARPYSSIYSLIDSAYTQNGKPFGLVEFQNISKEDAYNYYNIRIAQLKENLTNNPMWTEKDVDIVLEMDKDVKKPFILEYKDGYQRFFGLSILIMLLVLFVISFIISPIYSGEYANKTDSLILTSKNGKNLFIYAKIFTSLTISIIITLVFYLSTYFTCMLIYGFDGSNAQIQLIIPLLTYNFTLIEVTIMLLITSILGVIFNTSICIAISSITKKSIIPMTICSVLILIGLFNGKDIVLRYFSPLAMGSFYDIITQLIFEFFGTPIPLYKAASLISIVLSILLYVFSYKSFKNHQVV